MKQNKVITEQMKKDLRAIVSKHAKDNKILIASKLIIEVEETYSLEHIEHYLTNIAGLTQSEYLQALNMASHGKLLKHI